MSEKSIQVIIRFSSTQLELGEKKAASLGLSFNSWMKYLVTKEIESELNNKTMKQHQMTTVEMINADKKLIEELVEETHNSSIDPNTDLPY